MCHGSLGLHDWRRQARDRRTLPTFRAGVHWSCSTSRHTIPYTHTHTHTQRERERETHHRVRGRCMDIYKHMIMWLATSEEVLLLWGC